MWFYSLLSVILFSAVSFFTSPEKTVNHLSTQEVSNSYSQLGFDDFSHVNYEKLACYDLSFTAFKEALLGYYKLIKNGRLKNTKYLTIVDFGKASNEKRLFLIDVEEMTLVHQTYCAHGKNSGKLYATDFSNENGSYKSSLGFYLTSETYTGKFDLGLRLDGIEPFNANARRRAIVMHGATYATEAFLTKNGGTLGRSLGCPALPMEEAPEVIHKIKEGSCLYIYHPSHSYRSQSDLLKYTKEEFDFSEI